VVTGEIRGIDNFAITIEYYESKVEKIHSRALESLKKWKVKPFYAEKISFLQRGLCFTLLAIF
jgi:hypothetical protein